MDCFVWFHAHIYNFSALSGNYLLLQFLSQVCRNESSHLRGNVYVQFQSVDSALTAYSALNGRFYASKQVCMWCVLVTCVPSVPWDNCTNPNVTSDYMWVCGGDKVESSTVRGIHEVSSQGTVCISLQFTVLLVFICVIQFYDDVKLLAGLFTRDCVQLPTLLQEPLWFVWLGGLG